MMAPIILTPTVFLSKGSRNTELSMNFANNSVYNNVNDPYATPIPSVMVNELLRPKTKPA